MHDYRTELPNYDHSSDVLSKSSSVGLTSLSKMLLKFAATDAPVLITGESGTGKEVAARAVHAASRRHDKPLVTLNCAALPSALIASELFGYEKGAFTGALARKIGQVEHAHGGTLFLDEIGDMPIDLQCHLLRFLQEGTITRIGGRGEAIKVDVRIIAATNVDLAVAIRKERFREDLFFRLNVLSLHMPPLRERKADFEPLVHRFLAESSCQIGRRMDGIAPKAMAMLEAHKWPGNLRELKSAIFRAAVMCTGTIIQAENLSLMILTRGVVQQANIAPMDLPRYIAQHRTTPISREELVAALVHHENNVSACAQELGISRVTLYRKLRRLDVILDRANGLQADHPLAVIDQHRQRPFGGNVLSAA